MMLGRLRPSALLPALCVTALLGTGPRQYAPRWRVGDWWITKVWQQFENGSWLWHLERYDVAGIAEVDSSQCFLLKVRLQSSKGHTTQVGSDFYVRESDWRVVRQTKTSVNRARLLSIDTIDCPLGFFGPVKDEPRLPQFPLRLSGKTDTTFALRQRNDRSLLVREVPGVASAALVTQLLNAGDTTGRRVVRPTGPVYVVRSEMLTDSSAESAPGPKQLTRSLQLWSKEQPWRVYEELVRYDGPESTRWVVERTWLTASGHTDK